MISNFVSNFEDYHKDYFTETNKDIYNPILKKMLIYFRIVYFRILMNKEVFLSLSSKAPKSSFLGVFSHSKIFYCFVRNLLFERKYF